MIGRTNVCGSGSAPVVSYSIYGWCQTVGLSYAMLSDIPEADMRTLMTKYASVAYFMEWYLSSPSMIDQFIANTYAMKWIGLRDYICDKLLAFPSVKTAMLASDNWEYILKDHVPIMTANTAPYGECIGMTNETGHEWYKAFDGNDSTNARGHDHEIANGAYVGYKFANPIKIKRIVANIVNGAQNTVRIEASNDGTNWTAISETFAASSTIGAVTLNVSNEEYYLYYRAYQVSSSAANFFSAATIQFYGRALNVSVPKMTSNTAPYGEVLHGTYPTGTAYLAFDHDYNSSTELLSASATGNIGYAFPLPIKVKFLHGYWAWSSATSVNIEYSDDGTHWNILQTESVSNYEFNVPLENAEPHRYWRINFTRATSSVLKVIEVNFFGVDYSERTDRTYLYDHGVILEPESVSGWVFSTLSGGRVVEATKESRQIYFPPASNAYDTYTYATASKVNLTNFSHIRVKAGDKAIKYDSLYASVSVHSVKDISTYVSRILISEDILPLVASLDVSSLNDSYYVCLRTGVQRSYSFTELWLE